MQITILLYRLYIKMFLTVLFALSSLFFSSNIAFAQLIKTQGVSNIKNYGRQTYGGAHQIWAIEQATDGTMFYASFSDLIEYNGVQWYHYPVGKNTNLRSLKYHNGKLYSGGLGAFGVWHREMDGSLLYEPIIDLNIDGKEEIDEFWKIYTLDGRMYVQSFNRIFVLEDDKVVTQIQAPSEFHFSFVVDQKMYVQDKTYGIYELRDNKLEPLISESQIGEHEIWGMFRLRNNELVLASYKGKLFRFTQGELKEWSIEVSDFLQENSIFSIEPLRDGYIAIGTILGGVVVINDKGEAIQQINKPKGLQNNTVLSLKYDAQGDLWLGLDNGIAFLHLNSPYTFHTDVEGVIGAVYCALNDNGRFFMGTNQGLLSTEAKKLQSPLSSADFSLHEGTQGQVWALTKFRGALLCGHDKGVFRIGEKVEQISKLKGGWTFQTWPSDSSVLLVGTYTGLAVLKYSESGAIVEHSILDGFMESARFVEVDQYENIWVSHPLKGLYRLRLDDDFSEITEKEFYGKKKAIGIKTDNYVLRFEDEVVFSSPTGYFNYDVIKNDFVPNVKLNELLGIGLISHRMLQQDTRTWYTNDNAIGYLAREGNVYRKVESRYNSQSNFIPNFSNVFSVNDSTLALASYDGLNLFHVQQAVEQKTYFSPKIRLMKAIGKSDTLLVDLKKVPVSIPYDNNFLKIDFSVPNYEQLEYKVQYRTNNSQWKYAQGRTIALPNLSFGSYNLQFRLLYDKQEVEGKVMQFVVQKPWYFSTWALAFWALIIVAVAFVVRTIYWSRLRKAQLELEQQKKEELRLQQEHYENEALKSQQTIMVLENEQLETEVRFKSKELANMVINNIDKNEVLMRVKNELQNIQNEASQKIPKKYYNRLMKLIEQNLSTEDDWKVFELNFNKAYEGFFKKLKAKHASLTPNDLRLSAYLRMNLSSKDIAPLLNISVRSVEVSRYRLRKKIDLPRDKNLIEYMLEI